MIATEGIGGLWKWVVEKVSHLEEVVMGQLRELVTTQIVNAGITWLISMLNPAAAFIKACKLIYDVVMFFVEKADQIKEFIDSILDSIESIAGGGVGAAADYIEKTLVKMLPVLLGFLASLLSLGSIPNKIKILATVQKPIMGVVDTLVAGAVKYGKKLTSGAKRFGKRAVGKFGLGKDETPQQKQKRLDDGVRAGVAAANRFAGKPVAGRLLKPLLGAIKIRYRMAGLDLVPDGERWAVEGWVNPRKKGATQAKVDMGGASPLLGNIAPHASQPSPRPGSGDPVRAMWSEHVVPRSYVDSLLRVNGLAKVTETEYDSMTTILIYGGARRYKDFGFSGDFSLLRGFKGRTVTGKTAGRVGAGDSPAKARRAFEMLSTGAVRRTVEAVFKDHADQTAKRLTGGKPEPAAPTEDRIRLSAATQRQEIEAMVQARSSWVPV